MSTEPSERMPLATYPYGGRSPFVAGSATSEQRAAFEDAEGETARRQRETLLTLVQRGTRGATWRELASAHGMHHGQASSVLSVLHKAGRISRLAVSRDNCRIYVAHGFEADRPTEDHGRSGEPRRCPHCGGRL